MNPGKTRLNPEQLQQFEQEMDALRAEVAADLGAQDARYIRRIVTTARSSSATGRGLLAFGFDPITWVLGVIALAKAKILENMEVGHNVIHGQYDWMNDPKLSSRDYEWDIACASSHWKHTHNYEHHSHTNVLGKDDDYGYGVFRLCRDQRWSWHHLFQPFWYLLLAINFQWGVAVQRLKAGQFLSGGLPWAEFKSRAKVFANKAWGQLFKDYILFPLLTLWNWPRVVLGNLAANLIRNVWTNAVIFCGHFTTHAHTYTESEVEGETRGGWYLRQIQGSSNLKGRRWFHIMTGHLSFQIEHHLFPDIPARRYPEIAPKVRAICARFGVHYNTGRFSRQYFSVIGRILRYAWPSRKRAPATGGPAAEAV